MGWYVSNGGSAPIGPFDDAGIMQMIREGRIQPLSNLCAEGTTNWVKVYDTPFVSFLSANTAPAASSGEGLGNAILLIPSVMIFPILLFSSLRPLPQVFSFLTVMVSAILISSEASQLGMGKRPDSTGKTGDGPIAWFFVSLLFWAIAMPLYMHRRRLYGKKSMVVGGIVVSVIFITAMLLAK